MELNGWTSRQMLTRYGTSARGRRSYDRIWTTLPDRQPPPPATPFPGRPQEKRATATIHRHAEPATTRH